MDAFRHTVDISAPPERVWTVMADVDRWREWTPSIASIRRRSSDPLEVGQWALVRQPRLPPALWRVTSVEQGRAFTWVSSGPGFRVTGIHALEPLPAGTRVTLAIEIRGLLGPLLARLTGTLTDRYITLEAAGLKRRCESPADPNPIPGPHDH
jgi:uncharacterized protein YndB with AHSA1/START domain